MPYQKQKFKGNGHGWHLSKALVGIFKMLPFDQVVRWKRNENEAGMQMAAQRRANVMKTGPTQQIIGINCTINLYLECASKRSATPTCNRQGTPNFRRCKMISNSLLCFLLNINFCLLKICIVYLRRNKLQTFLRIQKFAITSPMTSTILLWTEVCMTPNIFTCGTRKFNIPGVLFYTDIDIAVLNANV